jgi:hypothetical protein
MLASQNPSAIIVISTNETRSTELWCIIFNTSEIKIYRHRTNFLGVETTLAETWNWG